MYMPKIVVYKLPQNFLVYGGRLNYENKVLTYTCI